MSIATAQDIINVIVDNALQQYPIYCIDGSELVLDAGEYAIVIHLDDMHRQNQKEATYQYPNNWRTLNDKQLNDALQYYYRGDYYEPEGIDLPCYHTNDWTMEEVKEILESNIVQIHPILPYFVVEVVPFKMYNLINDIFEEIAESYRY